MSQIQIGQLVTHKSSWHMNRFINGELEKLSCDPNEIFEVLGVGNRSYEYNLVSIVPGGMILMKSTVNGEFCITKNEYVIPVNEEKMEEMLLEKLNNWKDNLPSRWYLFDPEEGTFSCGSGMTLFDNVSFSTYSGLYTRLKMKLEDFD